MQKVCGQPLLCPVRAGSAAPAVSRLQEVPEVRGQALELVVREVQPAGAALWGTRHTAVFLCRVSSQYSYVYDNIYSVSSPYMS